MINDNRIEQVYITTHEVNPDTYYYIDYPLVKLPRSQCALACERMNTKGYWAYSRYSDQVTVWGKEDENG